MAGTAQTHKTPQRGIVKSANQDFGFNPGSHRVTRLAVLFQFPSTHGFLTKKLVSRFVQTPFGTAGICREVTDQFTREFVDVGTFEVIELLASRVEN